MIRPIARARSRLDSRSSLGTCDLCAPIASILVSIVSVMSAKHWPIARDCAFISGDDRNASRSHGVRRSADTKKYVLYLFAAIATVAVGARGVAAKMAASRAGYGTLAMRGIEVAAAALIIAFGALLLAGYLATERLVGLC